MSGRERRLDDLLEAAGKTADEAASSGGGEKGTGEWVAETVELLDKRGILEPILFGPEGAEELRQQNQQAVENATQGEGGEGEDADADAAPALDAEGIAGACDAIMDQLGDDVTVAEVKQICEDNPSMVNKQIQQNL